MLYQRLIDVFVWTTEARVRVCIKSTLCDLSCWHLRVCRASVEKALRAGVSTADVVAQIEMVTETVHAAANMRTNSPVAPSDSRPKTPAASTSGVNSDAPPSGGAPSSPGIKAKRRRLPMRRSDHLSLETFGCTDSQPYSHPCIQSCTSGLGWRMYFDCVLSAQPRRNWQTCSICCLALAHSRYHSLSGRRRHRHLVRKMARQRP